MNVSTHSSILGGSNAARLLACPASYAEQLKYPQPDVTSVYAEEGTMLHSMIAGMVGGEGAVEDMITDDQAEVLMTAKRTLDDLKQRYGGKFRVVGVESMLPLPGITGAFGSVDLVLSNKTTVLVIDWKFGKGVPVKALYERTDGTEVWDEINPQLAFYAAAARARFKRSFKNKTIVLAIIQPRFPQPLDHVEVTDLELDEFLLAFQQRYLEALGKNAPREKGEHCRFASCKATCPLWVGPVIELSVLDPKRAALEASTKPIAATDDYGAYLSRAMHLAVLAETWAGEIRKQSHVYLDDGGFIPDWKLVPKRGMRKWTSEEDAPFALHALGGKDSDIFTEPELRSVAQVESRLKKRGVELPNDLWIMSSSGTTIVPSDDPRPESSHGQVVENVRKALKAL